MRRLRFLVGFWALSCSSGPSGSSQGPPPAPSATLPFPVSATLVSLFDHSQRRSATALAFNPNVKDELWVVWRSFPVAAPCTRTSTFGCGALAGEVVQLGQASSAQPTATLKRDYNAWHFMRRPSSIAFGDNGNLGTCGEARTGNYDDEIVDYTGPVLWSADPKIFGAQPTGNQNGTHLDMLHNTPFCMGIAHERDNVYWTFNGQLGALDRYDFKQPHEIGGENHWDGELHRHLTGDLLRVPEVPSHLALDATAGELFVADTGHARVLRVKLGTGKEDGNVPTLDPMAVHRKITGTEFQVLPVPAGLLVAPSGLAFKANLILVTDNATSQLHAFTRDGRLVQSIDTGLPVGSLAGVAVAPDGTIYLSDLLSGRAYRVEGQEPDPG